MPSKEDSWLSIFTFGGDNEVTGSSKLIEVTPKGGKEKRGYLMDCGLFTGKSGQKANTNISCFIGNVVAAFATHAHVDHIGRFPYIYRLGYNGPIYATPEVIALANNVLPDSGKIQEENYKLLLQKTGVKSKEIITAFDIEPLYTAKDGTDVIDLFVPVERGITVKVDEFVEATFYNAGHALGSASIMLNVTNGEESIRLYFSGDIGDNNPLLKARRDSFKKDVDFVFMESTYAGRTHRPRNESWNIVRELAAKTLVNGGNVVLPCFSVGRTQSIWYLFYMDMMTKDDWVAKAFRETEFYIDSQLSVLATGVFRRFPEEFKAEAQRAMKNPDNNPFNYQSLKFCSEVEDSKALTTQKNNYVVFSAAGMCNAGRVLFHLEKDLPNPNSSVIFTGYQAEGTLGRILVSGAKQVKIHGKPIEVNATVVSVNGFSAHVDQAGLEKWLRSIEPGYTLFLCHGEPDTQNLLRDALDADGVIPKEKVELLATGRCYHLYKGGFEVTTFCIPEKKISIPTGHQDSVWKKEMCNLGHFHDVVESVMDDPLSPEALHILTCLEQAINAELTKCKKKKRQSKPNKSKTGCRRR